MKPLLSIGYLLLLLHHSVPSVFGFNRLLFLNPPAEPVAQYSLQILYSCSEPALVQLEALVTFDTGRTSAVLHRHWSCEPGPSRIRTLLLSLPDWLVFQADWAIGDSDWVLAVLLRAWVTRDGLNGAYRSAEAHAMTPLTPRPPFSRPLKKHQLCPSWEAQLRWEARRATINKCTAEREIVNFLLFLYASTGEHFGVIRAIDAYGNDFLEHLRQKAISYPWCAFSTWLFLTNHCQQHLCAILHHIDSHQNYSTPTLFLTSSGKLHVQVHGNPGVSSAFLCPFHVPLGQWCHINLELRGSMVNIIMVCIDGQNHSLQHAEHQFKETVLLDDTDGYFVLGGSEFVKGIEGYFGPSMYYRNKIPSRTESEVTLPRVVRNLNFTGWLQSCEEFQLDLQIKMNGYSERISKIKESLNTYWRCLFKDNPPHTNSWCEPWEAPSSYQRKHAVRLTEKLAIKHGGTPVKLTSVGQALYSLALRRLPQNGNTRAIRRVMALLLQAGCLGDNRALHLSSVFYSSGFGVKRQPNKARLLSLLAAQKDWRLSLLRLGHLHHLGESDISPDLDLAYAYYSNIAKQTSSDRLNPSPQQVFVESIYLHNEEQLKMQTNENDDLFHWLKLQARNGAAEAEHAIGRMLFWGQQGVAPDIQTAVKHYERGALRLQSPMSMYDYAIVLLQGLGVEKDVSRAVTFLRRAMEQGFAPAINALGWYYEQFEQDYEQAVSLWEQADLLGSPDAAMNLGVMYSQGLYPGRRADQFLAYTYFQKAAQRGNIDGAIQLADMWIKGLPAYLYRNSLNAVLWSKWVSDQNGFLGAVVRKAQDSHFKGENTMALIYYMMAAEAGFAAAQFNVAYLCEHNTGGFLEQTFAEQCMWRYYNFSVHIQRPEPYALIRMGDLLYDGHEPRRDVLAAVEMYKKAALSDDPQGWYSLGLLVQDGQVLPASLWAELGLPQLYVADTTEQLITFYSRCRDSDGTSYLPCSLALFHAHVLSFHRAYSSLKLSVAMVVVLIILPMPFFLLSVVRGRGMSRQRLTGPE